MLSGAGDRGRTGTVSLPTDFESVTSANSITPANQLFYYISTKHKNQVYYKIFYKNGTPFPECRKLIYLPELAVVLSVTSW